MRTTLTIDDGVLRQLRRKALDSGKPLKPVVEPGPRHWSLLRGLIGEAGAAGNLTADARLAALAIENDGTLYSADNDSRRFAGLRFRDPLR